MVSSNVTDKYSQFHIDLYLLHFHSFIIQFTRSHLLIFRHSVSQMKPGIYKNIGSLRQQSHPHKLFRIVSYKGRFNIRWLFINPPMRTLRIFFHGKEFNFLNLKINLEIHQREKIEFLFSLRTREREKPNFDHKA